ncbi:hypothetical protein NNG64_02810 [Bacillus siamensis]|uniref:hypothetical protein n=1 Tax=Bacillus TaxID=1386 RepID=UPI001910681E|nr:MULTISPECIES: hypothetical protein [Bacillus]UUA84771.1 hypothetical protein NNG64_02810 [Bacillus siamensis]
MYKKRREALKQSLNREFGDEVKIFGDSTGLHLIASFENVIFSEQVLKKLDQHKIKIYPVERHTIQKGVHKNKIILGYGNLAEKEIEEGIRRLKAALSAKALTL